MEFALLVKVYEILDLLPTLAIVVITGVVGAWAARMEGIMVIKRIHDDLSNGRLPAPHVVDGVLILIAAALLITPGLISDTIGFALLVPAVRSLIRARLKQKFERKFAQGAIEVKHWEW